MAAPEADELGAASAYLIKGDDAALVFQSLTRLLGEVLQGRDADSAVEEHGGGGQDIDPGAVVDALTTPPFLVDRRVVLVRDAGRLEAADAGRIATCLADPVPGVTLVLVPGGGTIPAALAGAVQKVGRVVDSDPPRPARARSQWLVDQVRSGPVRLDAKAAAVVGDHLGDDVGRLYSLLDSLAAAYGEGASVDEDALAPFLGEAGSVAPWELTDAIDSGNASDALAALSRLLGPGAVHPLAVMGTLHRHFRAMLHLDGSAATTAEAAAELIGSRSVYPAKKALDQSRKLGAARIGRAITLLADADLDLRGRSGLDDRMLLEVLVARLARLSPGAGPAAQSGGRRTARSGGGSRRR